MEEVSSVLGYGVRTDNIAWKAEAGKLLYEAFKDKSPLVREALEGWKEDNAADDGEQYADEFALMSYADEYENDTYCTSGLEALVADVLNDVFGSDLNLFHYDDCVIYVEATLPENEEAKTALPTTQWIKDTLEKYVDPLSENALDIGWFTIRL